MKKNMQVLSGVAVAIVSTGVVTNVHAEELPQKTETPPVVEANTTKQAKVTEADVATAKIEQDTAKEAVTKQEEVVTQAQKDVDTAKETLNQAQIELVEATELVEQATPENISKAKETINQAEDNVTEASQNLEAKTQAEATAQEAVKAQEKVVSTAQADVSDKTKAVTEAQKDVDTAQAILDGTGQAEVIAKAEQAEKQLAESKQALATAQTELANARQADANRQKAITEAEQALNQANQTLTNFTKASDIATVKATETETALESAQTAFTKAENDKNSINTIKLSAKYVTALEILHNSEYTKEQDSQGNWVFHDVVSKEMKKEAFDNLYSLHTEVESMNKYKTNPNADTTEYDVNNLPDEVITEISLFATDLINQIRAHFGTAPVVVSPSSVHFADLVTDGYVADQHDTWNKSHDGKAVNEAAHHFGLAMSADLGVQTFVQYYENWASSHILGKRVTLERLKKSIYNSLVLFMSGVTAFDAEWEHAGSISGVRYYNKDNKVTYLGVDVTEIDSAAGVHFLTVDDTQLARATKDNFDTTEIANPYSSEKIEEAYRQAQAKLQEAQEWNDLAQQAKRQALKAKAEAQVKVTASQAVLTSAQKVAVLTPKAEATFLIAQEAVKQSEAKHKEAQANLANLQADVKVKQENLAKAKQTLAQKQAILDKSKEQLSNEQATLSRLQATQNKAKEDVVSAKEQLSTAQTILKTAQFKLMSLEEAPTLLAQAKARLLKASTELKAKEAVLAEALEKLSGLKQDEAKASEHYQAVLKAYQEVLEAERQVKLAKEYESILRKGGQPVPVVDETGRVTGYMAAIPRVQALVAKSTPKATPTKATKAGLPNTGEQSSVLLPMLGLVGLLGLSITRRKKQH
ncbi:SEC10/PgrA surface exclusion domain-containing protein [Streptococcus suis]